MRNPPVKAFVHTSSSNIQRGGSGPLTKFLTPSKSWQGTQTTRVIRARQSKLILLWKVWDLRYIIKEYLPLTVPSIAELMHHLLQNRLPLTRRQEDNHQVFQRQVLGTEFRSNEWDMRPVFVAVRDPTIVMRTEPLRLQVILEAGLIHAVPCNFGHVRHGEVEGCSGDGIF